MGGVRKPGTPRRAAPMEDGPEYRPSPAGPNSSRGAAYPRFRHSYTRECKNPRSRSESSMRMAQTYQSRPNQRLIRLEPNCDFSAARPAEGPMSSPDLWSPKKVTSTNATSPAPNSR